MADGEAPEKVRRANNVRRKECAKMAKGGCNERKAELIETDLNKMKERLEKYAILRSGGNASRE